MSLAKFEREVLGDRVSKSDQVWFPRWIRRYAMAFRDGLHSDLPVNKGAAVKFSQSLRDNGAPAWQRLQAVRAIICYRDEYSNAPNPT